VVEADEVAVITPVLWVAWVTCYEFDCEAEESAFNRRREDALC
jgi:hypothetical protein